MAYGRFYVYCHRKKTDGKCFYIGKGTVGRYKHINGRNSHWNNIVNKHGFTWEILINNISEEKAFELESLICNQIGYENLCNLNQEKGNGGWTRSNETILKLKKPKPKGFGNQISKSKTKYTILQYSLNNIFIKEWDDAYKAAYSINKNSTAIRGCCTGERKTAYGFIWKYKLKTI
jgi:hypothetical protein